MRGARAVRRHLAGRAPRDTCPSGAADAFVDEERALRAELIDTIEDDFYKQVDEEKLDDASLKGIVDSLDDRFSHYLTPEEATQLQASRSAASSRASG